MEKNVAFNNNHLNLQLVGVMSKSTGRLLQTLNLSLVISKVEIGKCTCFPDDVLLSVVILLFCTCTLRTENWN